MAAIIYGLCALTALLCTILLFQAYRRNGSRLLLWSGLSFAGLTIDNVLLNLDKLFLPFTDLSILRYSEALLSMVLLVCGLIWEAQ